MEVFLVKSSYLLDNNLYYKIFKTHKQAENCALLILLGILNDNFGESYKSIDQVSAELLESVVFGVDQLGNNIMLFDDDFVASVTRLSVE